VRYFPKENDEVLSMNERDESLESYFISLVGGGEQ
jgi:ABC-2 type transport system ATP-binding protein